MTRKSTFIFIGLIAASYCITFCTQGLLGDHSGFCKHKVILRNINQNNGSNFDMNWINISQIENNFATENEILRTKIYLKGPSDFRINFVSDNNDTGSDVLVGKFLYNLIS